MARWIGHDLCRRAAPAWKNAFAERTGASLYVVTQFCFEAAPVIAWDKQRIQAEGNRLPVHVGLPGLATLKALIGHARACGVGPSMRFLTRQARNVAKLLAVSAPDRLVTAPRPTAPPTPDAASTGSTSTPSGIEEIGPVGAVLSKRLPG